MFSEKEGAGRQTASTLTGILHAIENINLIEDKNRAYA